jgi:hypothetical protein
MEEGEEEEESGELGEWKDRKIPLPRAVIFPTKLVAGFIAVPYSAAISANQRLTFCGI